MEEIEEKKLTGLQQCEVIDDFHILKVARNEAECNQELYSCLTYY